MQTDPIYAVSKFYMFAFYLLHGISTWRLSSIFFLKGHLYSRPYHIRSPTEVTPSLGIAAWAANAFDSWYHICLCAPEYFWFSVLSI